MSASPPANAHEGPAPAGNGRDANGRFTAGNKYGPGNPFARQTARLRKVLLEVVNEDEMRQVAFALLLRAKTGNLTAIKLLFQYVLGKPAEAVDPDRLDVEEWKLSQESRVNPVAVKETVDDMPAETANVLVRHVWPAATETNYLSAAREELDAMDREDAERAAAAQEKPAEANGENGVAPEALREQDQPAGARPRTPGGKAVNGRRKGGPAHKQTAGRTPRAKTTRHAPRPRGNPEGAKGHPGRRTETNGLNGKGRRAGGP